ncbi:assimilatory nitrite reductase (NAD(P)H) small subunit [Modicisalibacter muralis]|uniref:Assimilatory nitrite reductase (NAD(P)H) small subunit n=1 Tax=Modicisalibacter muralis TaxID=119000 RepID=A0A1G9HVK0_9GAMM|nr:nitrite reductase small subunit NirD [Halomonas muralis]SDL17000.1 assimilatory nitrite reductase (NAD(P)H) small subunit [Halomonas muralis]
MSTAMAFKRDTEVTWRQICTSADLVAHSGVAAWLETGDGSTQIALFYLPSPNTPELSTGPNTPELPSHAGELYAVDNHDPFSGANVIARGIVGDVKGEPVIASPLYKQHFRLSDGVCMEDSQTRLRHWPARFDGDRVMIAIAAAAVLGRI